MECQGCQLSSPIESFFTEIKKGVKLCPSCIYNRNNKEGWFKLTWVSLFLIVGHTMVAMEFDSFIQYYLLGAAWWMVFLYLSLAAHEYGHFFVCRVLGGVCPLVTVGEGRVFYRLKTKTALWLFSTNPSLGLAYAVFPEHKNEVWREVLMLLGGVFINFVLVLLSIFVLFHSSAMSLVGEWFWLFAVLMVVNSLLIIGSLFTSMKNKGLESDGYALYRLFKYGRETDFSKNQKLAYQFIVSHTLSIRGEFKELEEFIQANDDYKNSMLGLTSLSSCYFYSYKTSEFLQTAIDAMELFHNKTEVLPEGVLEEAVSAIIMNNLAFALYSTRSDDKEKILSLAKEAYELMPWEHAIKATYGAALVYSNTDIVGGADLLESIIKKPINANDQLISINYYCLAEAYVKLGELKKAEAASHNAHRLNPNVERYFLT